MLKGLIGSVIAVGLSSSPIVNKPIDNSIVSPTTQAVIYDDPQNTITFNTTELNEYVWEELSLYLFENKADLIDDGDFPSTHVSYGEDPLNYYLFDDTELSFHDGSSLYINFNFTSHKWEYISNSQQSDFLLSITWDLSNAGDTYYFPIKSAIELDIQANQPAENNMPSVSDLFGYITQGVNAFIGSLGQAFESVVALFWDSTATTPGPTFLGLLMLISIGAGLIFLAYNVIKKLVYRVRG